MGHLRPCLSRADSPNKGLGTVTPLHTVTVRTQVDGRLEKVFFKEGQDIRPGQVLAQVDPRPYLIQLHTAEGSLLRDTGLLRDATLNLERYKKLRPQRLVSEQQVDDQQSLVTQYEGAVKIDQASIDSARLNLEYARILSPIHGMVRGLAGIRSVDSGNIVHAADATGIVVLTQLDPISVIFTLPQDALEQVLTALAGPEPPPVQAFGRTGKAGSRQGHAELIDNQSTRRRPPSASKAIFPQPPHQALAQQVRQDAPPARDAQGRHRRARGRPPEGPLGTFAYVAGPDETVRQGASASRPPRRPGLIRAASPRQTRSSPRDRTSSGPAPRSPRARGASEASDEAP